MALSKEETASIVKKFGKDEKDTGSTEVQIALLTARIKDLTAHLKAHKQDAGAHRSLLILVGNRRSLLDYLNRSNPEGYFELIAKLGIRK